MKLEYFIKKKKINNLKSGEVENKYVATLLQKSAITTESLCKEIEVGSTLSRYEAELAIAEWSDVVLDSLLQGRPVELGKLGTLRPRLEAKAQDNPEEVDFKTISKVKCVFYPSKELVKRLNQAPLHKRSYMPKRVE